MKKFSLIKKFFALTTLLPLVANAGYKQSYQPPYFSDDTRLAKIQRIFPEIDKIYQNFAAQHHFPGYAYGIVVDGKLVYANGNGYINVNKKIPATPQSLFRIASMTKSFTAMAILKLRDEGKLKLDDPVYLYIPAFKNQQITHDSPPITIRNLLTHSSGLPQDDPWGDRKLATTDDDLVALLKGGVAFSNAPGTNYEYSNLAFSMLGYIIKKVSGEPYQDYIAKNILQPLGMQTEWEYSKVPADKLAQGYKWVDNQWKPEPLLHNGTFGAMGGLITSIDAFSHYMALHLSAWPPRDDTEAGLIRRSSLREMQQPWRLNVEDDGSTFTSAYGYGLSWKRDTKARVFIGHSGGLPGFGSNWLILPEYGVGVVLFANATYAPAEEVNLTVLNTLVREAQLKPRTLPVSTALVEKQKALMTILPDWKNAETSGIFSSNFFLDHTLATLQKETATQFSQIGKITHISDIIPENQLRGYFMVEGQKGILRVKFTLTPQAPPLIQSLEIKPQPLQA